MLVVFPRWGGTRYVSRQVPYVLFSVGVELRGVGVALNPFLFRDYDHGQKSSPSAVELVGLCTFAQIVVAGDEFPCKSRFDGE